MASKVQSVIVSEIRDSKYFAFSVDSTPDLSHTDQLTLTVRYLSQCGTIRERFLQFIDIYNHSAENLCDVITTALQRLKIDIADCRGLATDNAANMSGQYSGLQKRLKDINHHINFVPCAAHSLNLVGSCAAESCLSAVNFFGILQTVYNFFSASTHRWSVLESNLPKGLVVVKTLSNTRWSARADATKALAKGYSNIQSALQSIMNDKSQQTTTRTDAGSLVTKLSELETALMTLIWQMLLQRFQATSESLQRYDIDVGTVIHLYDSLSTFIEDKRDHEVFTSLERKAKVLSGDSIYKKTTKRKYAVLFPDDPRSDDVFQVTVTSASDKFRTQSFLQFWTLWPVKFAEDELHMKLSMKSLQFCTNILTCQLSKFYNAQENLSVVIMKLMLIFPMSYFIF
jgi:hypothetical protein